MSRGDLDMGHPDLDAQHEALEYLLGDVRRAVEAGDVEGARGTVEALWNASVAHFATEERLMEASSYPERNPHRTAHHLFLEDLDALVRALAAQGLTDEVAAWATKRVPGWIAFHVETNDAPLARYLARKASRATGAGGDLGPGVPRGRGDA